MGFCSHLWEDLELALLSKKQTIQGKRTRVERCFIKDKKLFQTREERIRREWKRRLRTPFISTESPIARNWGTGWLLNSVLYRTALASSADVGLCRSRLEVDGWSLDAYGSVRTISSTREELLGVTNLEGLGNRWQPSSIWMKDSGGIRVREKWI